MEYLSGTLPIHVENSMTDEQLLQSFSTDQHGNIYPLARDLFR